ncbi:MULTISPECIES: Rpn family recombination-promoting nuclease/putative transposase [unclassified Halanaerobium]|uniref:Rpn family recombination-promoting nuclease/putative transposase n=1 Tax=unclassified Halanaerobium TaxID=2641197 RepID=UPI0021016344|nr:MULTISPECIES: Rpn family recombination-promoting nuclease/putative transposase [unclassified Halanaerobium]
MQSIFLITLSIINLLPLNYITYAVFYKFNPQNNQFVIFILKYMTEIWDQHLKQNNSEKLPLILPLLIYHGDRRYNMN